MAELESLATEESAERHIARHHLDRLIMLSDGVFAIAITLAAVEIHIPEAAGTLALVLNQAGVELFTYLISFVVIAGYWISNRELFARVNHVDRTLTSLSLCLLCVVALIPAAAHGAHVRNELTGSLRFYALIMVISGLINLAMWAYASFASDIMSKDVPRGERWHRIAIAGTIPFLFLVVLLMPTVEAFKWTAPLAILVVLARRFTARSLLRRKR
jgi:uncharacterized membrane protein